MNISIFDGKIGLVRGAIANPEAIMLASKHMCVWESANDPLRDNSVLHLENQYIYPKLVDEVNSAILEYLNMAFDELGVFFSLGAQITSLNVCRYHTGGQATLHKDNGIDAYTGAMTVVVYPNDDYAGGDIVFPEQGVDIKPIAGDIFIFPSNTPHLAKPTTSGMKYFGLTFFNVNDCILFK